MNEKMNNRPTWDQYFMGIAEKVAERSTCIHRSVGAVIVIDKRILTTGYNGPPTGLQHCSETGCARKDVPSGERLDLCRAVHAEVNAVVQAAKCGIAVDGGTLYCTLGPPCWMCSNVMVNAGIVKVVVSTIDYPDARGLSILNQASVVVKCVDAVEIVIKHGKKEVDDESGV